mmetsp:Transcript_25144/g.77520  ORF Transcript_25144/g.77520 Transcript_25144/m.77520 type:complete len:86 (-) Transcript_25144:626-883(-)
MHPEGNLVARACLPLLTLLHAPVVRRHVFAPSHARTRHTVALGLVCADFLETDATSEREERGAQSDAPARRTIATTATRAYETRR